MKFKICLWLIFLLSTIPVMAAEVSVVLDETTPYVTEMASSAGGEWAVLGLSRRGDMAHDAYYQSLTEVLAEKQGKLSVNKYTEYARTVLALAAMGRNPANVGGYDLTAPLLAFDRVTVQGINGSVFALLALDSVNAPNADIREKYIDDLLSKQLPDGGFSMGGERAELDMTAMVLTALSKYTDREAVRAAVDRALACMSSELEKEKSAFEAEQTAEGMAQTLVALCELGIELYDPRFVKDEQSVLDMLFAFYKGGGFSHTVGGEVNGMATQQAFYALVCYERLLKGQSSLFRIADMQAGRFADISESDYKNEIESLAGLGIINGISEREFAPQLPITRAEFAALTTLALDLPMGDGDGFSDVSEESWYAGYVRAARNSGIISGVSESEFAPEAPITREAAAAIMARCAERSGVAFEISNADLEKTLSVFPDYADCSDWALQSLAFCYSLELIQSKNVAILPKQAAKREEIAGLLYNLLVLLERI